MKDESVSNIVRQISLSRRYKAEFLKLSDEFQRYKEEIEKEVTDYFLAPSNDEDDKQLMISTDKVFQIGEKIFPGHPVLLFGYTNLRLFVRKGLIREENAITFEQFVARYTASTLEIVFASGNEILKSEYLDLAELGTVKDLANGNYQKNVERILGPNGEDSKTAVNLSVASAINENDSTIMVKLHLDRKKEDIIRDITLLLNLVQEETKLFDIALDSPKRPQWDVYDKYLRVYDLKKANPNMEWSEIARRVFPEEVIKGRKPVHRKVRKEELAQDSAVSKVFHYWKEANRMINKGGWRQI